MRKWLLLSLLLSLGLTQSCSLRRAVARRHERQERHERLKRLERLKRVSGQRPQTQGNFTPLLPQTWVNGLEYLNTTTYTIDFPTTGTGGAWTCSGAGSYGPYAAGSSADLQQALNDAETCRTLGTGHPGTTIIIPAGVVFTSVNGLFLPQTAGDDPVANTNFIIMTSSSPLPLGQTACSHGLAAQDNLPQSISPALRNYGCDGSALSYQLGTTVTNIAPGAFTYANGIQANTANFNDRAHMYVIQASAGGSNPIGATNVDSNNVAPHHYAILNAELSAAPGVAAYVAPIAFGSSAVSGITLMSQIPVHMHMAYDYIHGDMSDGTVSADGTTVLAPAVGAASLPNAIALNGCLYCSFSYLYIDKVLRPGGEGHGFATMYGQKLKFVHNWVEGSSINNLCGGLSITSSLFTGSGVKFHICEDWEDRGNRYTYPRTWNLLASLGWNPNIVFQTTGGTGTGASFRLLNAQLTGGCLWSAAPFAAGSGYSVNDVLTLSPNFGSTSATGGTMIVTAVNGSGGVTAATNVVGSGYTLGTALATTVTTNCSTTAVAAGTGATVNITQVSPTGGIMAAQVNNGGSGYALNNYLTVVQAGASGGTLRVGTVSSGAVTQVMPMNGRSYNNSGFVKKNAHEAKSTDQALLDGNVIENNDYSGAQGTTLSFKSNNMTGGGGENYWAHVSDVTITNNIIRHGCQGISMGYRSGLNGGGGAVLPAENFLYRNNLMYDIDTTNPGCQGLSTSYGIRVAWNSKDGAGWTQSTAQEDATGTTATITLAPAAAGYNQSTISVGDPVLVTGCTGGTNPAGFSMSGTVLGPLAIAPTDPTTLTVYINWTTTANSTATGCTVSYGQGWPQFVVSEHDSEFLNGNTTTWDIQSDQGGTTTNPYTMARNIYWTDTISVNSAGIAASPLGEGTRTQTVGFDPASEIMHHLILTGRDSKVTCPGTGTNGIDKCYSAWDNNHVPITPPSSTIFGTPTPWCTTSDPTVGDCIGVIGLMGQSSYNGPALNDWHLYRLCHSGDIQCNGLASKYAAGGIRQASDGTDMGPDFTQIEVAQTRSQYPATGTYPDYPGGGTAPPSTTALYLFNGAPGSMSGQGTWK